MAQEPRAASHAAPDGGGRPPQYREPTFGQRLVARLIDTAVLLPLIALAGILAEGRVRALVGLLLVAGYEITLVTRSGQTVGKRVMSTRIVDRETGALPDVRQVVIRWLVVIGGSVVALVVPALDPLAPIATLVVLLPAMRPPLHLGLHDLAAGTIVTSTLDL